MKHTSRMTNNVLRGWLIAGICFFCGLYLVLSPSMAAETCRDILMAFVEDGEVELLDCMTAKLGDNNKYIIAIFRLIDSDLDLSPTTTLNIYRDEKDETELVISRQAERIQFVGADLLDINKDGRKELVFREECTGTGWDCEKLAILGVHAGRLIDLLQNVPGHLIPREVSDVDGDGIYEVLALDGRWEELSPFIPHVSSPQVVQILTWSGAGYVFETTKFREYYLEEIAKLERSMPETRDDMVAVAITKLLYQLRVSDEGVPWKEFKASIEKIVGSTEEAANLEIEIRKRLIMEAVR